MDYTIDEDGYHKLDDEYKATFNKKPKKRIPRLATIAAWCVVLFFLVPWIIGTIQIFKSIFGGIL